MALHRTPAEHDANPPSTWLVVKAGPGRWHLQAANGDTIDSFTTKSAAQEATTSGFFVKLYNDEGRWMSGEAVNGWKPFKETS